MLSGAQCVGPLNLPADSLLVTQHVPGIDAEVLNLDRIGASDLMGNVAYFANNDLLVRAGVADTNHHRIVFLKRGDDLSYTGSELLLTTDTDKSHRWTLDAMALGDYWWVLNADDGEFLRKIELPADVDPFDLLVWKD